MIAQYTEIYKDFISRVESLPDENISKQAWNNFITEMNTNFPKFSINITQGEIVFNLSDLIYKRYKDREIGAETEDLFLDNMDKTLSEVIIMYAKKVDTLLNKIDTLLDRTVEINSSGNNYNFLYPVSKDSEKLDSKIYYDNKKEQSTAFFKSNAEIMNTFLNIKNIYKEVVDYFEQCFLGVY